MLAKNETTTPWMLKNAARKVRNFYQPKDFTLLYIRIESPYLDSPYTQSFPPTYKVIMTLIYLCMYVCMHMSEC